MIRLLQSFRNRSRDISRQGSYSSHTCLINTSTTPSQAVPVIDISALIQRKSWSEQQIVAAELRHACEKVGFFHITGHGVDNDVQQSILTAAQEFFKRPQEEKNLLSIRHSASGGR